MSATVRLAGVRGLGKVTILDEVDADRFGSTRWLLHSAGYVSDGHGAYLHRLVVGAPAGMEVDHINGDKLDNRRANLRVCSRAENMRNRRSPKQDAGQKGVHRAGAAWEARIGVASEHIHLGCFSTPEAAAFAYDEAARRLHGEFASVNGVGPEHAQPALSRARYLFNGERLTAATIAARVGADKKTVYMFVAKGLPLESLADRLPNGRTHEERLALVRALLAEKPGLKIVEVARLLRMRKTLASRFVRQVRGAAA